MLVWKVCVCVYVWACTDQLVYRRRCEKPTSKHGRHLGSELVDRAHEYACVLILHAVHQLFHLCEHDEHTGNGWTSYTRVKDRRTYLFVDDLVLRDIVQVGHGGRREWHGRRVDGQVAIGLLFLPPARPFRTDDQAVKHTRTRLRDERETWTRVSECRSVVDTYLCPMALNM